MVGANPQEEEEGVMATTENSDKDQRAAQAGAAPTSPSAAQVSQDMSRGQQDTGDEAEKSSEQEEREQLIKDQEAAALENGQLTTNPYNDNESAHQRWLETGQTEPDFMIPEQDEDGDDEDDSQSSTRSRTKKTTAKKSGSRSS